MPQTYSLAAKQTLTIDAPIRNFEVQQGSVIVSKHDELIPKTVKTDETFGCDDRGGIDFFSPDSATVSVLFADEAKLAESGRHPGESEKRGRKRRRQKKAAPKKPAAKRKRASKAKKKASRGDTGGGDSGGFESRTVDQLRAEAAKRKISGRSTMDKSALIKALRS